MGARHQLYGNFVKVRRDSETSLQRAAPLLLATLTGGSLVTNLQLPPRLQPSLTFCSYCIKKLLYSNNRGVRCVAIRIIHAVRYLIVEDLLVTLPVRRPLFKSIRGASGCYAVNHTGTLRGYVRLKMGPKIDAISKQCLFNTSSTLAPEINGRHLIDLMAHHP
jgi:hypothetical protein